MAVIFADGFDWYTFADMGKRWTLVASTTLVGSSYARMSGQGVRTTGATLGGIAKSFGVNYVSGVLGFAINFEGTAVSRIVAIIGDGGSEQISIRTNASSVLTVTRGGTVLATGSTVLSVSTWYFMELKFTIADSTGVVELKLNGASEIASTGSLDTKATSAAQWNGIIINGFTNAVIWYDDLYVLDTASGSNTDFLGPVQVIARWPNGAGNYAQWTSNGGSNAGNVGEPYEDGDMSFNQSSTANQIDTFTMQDLPAAAGSVYAVQVHNVAKQDGGAARSIAPVVRISGTDYVGSTVATSTSYQMLTQVYDTSPATSSAWSVSEANGTETGYKLIS
jgi:hypothetical protein